MERPNWQKILEFLLSSNSDNWELGYILLTVQLKGQTNRDTLLSVLFGVLLFSPIHNIDPSNEHTFDKKLRKLLQKEDAYFFRKLNVLQSKIYAITDRYAGAPEIQYLKMMELLDIQRLKKIVLPIIFNHRLIYLSGHYLELGQWKLTHLLLSNQLDHETIKCCLLSDFARQQQGGYKSIDTYPVKQLNLHFYIPKITEQLEALLSKYTSVTFFKNGLEHLPKVLYENRALIFLYIYSNPIKGLEEACQNWTELYELQFSYCKYMTNFPKTMHEMKALKKLTIDHCRLKQIPEEILEVAQLERLELSQNKIAVVPEKLAMLQALKMLNLNQNLPLGKIPEAVYQLCDLQKLWLKDCAITKVPNAITQLTKLQDLRLSHNPIKVLPANFTDLENLVHLQLERTQMRCDEAFWETILGLKSLKHLEMFGVKVRKDIYQKYKTKLQKKLTWFKLHEYYLY